MLFQSLVLASIISIPLSEPAQWQILDYNKIPANKVDFSGAGLTLSIDRSASPIIYPLATTMSVKKIRVTGQLNGLLKLPSDLIQGGKTDDFTLRVGLVLKGEKQLNWLQRKVAADWITTLYGLALRKPLSPPFTCFVKY